MTNQALLALQDVSIHYGSVKAVSNITLHIHEGELIGLVGESGSGKSTLARGIMGLEKLTTGDIYFRGEKLNHKRSKADKQAIQMVFQDASAAMNPRMKLKEIMQEGVNIHFPDLSREAKQKRVHESMRQVGLTEHLLERYPHELSGGQRQRIGLARSIILKPKVLIADEIISGLDVSNQATILTLLQKLKETEKMAYLFITHDLSIVPYVCDRVAIMTEGKIVEIGRPEELFQNPQHPYTQSLLSSVPIADPIREEKREIVDYYKSSERKDHLNWYQITKTHAVLQ
ncbi:ABC transporter ATP-binding protein [Dolosigranulum pigrum]|uniref:ABC transporter ATP-binding protein n=1 Tax=Dolosigranulum pigrum TaxID=29394 RepID=UPI001AD87B9E|nr:ABC transporter ATP-binding protein [Dolosigranulum pigrum]QTJ55685.1 ABC transporter ATP-binding protein [Dolosigranulum pigrum]